MSAINNGVDIDNLTCGDGADSFPDVEYAESAIVNRVSDFDDQEDFYITSSGLTPVQELARALKLVDL